MTFEEFLDPTFITNVLALLGLLVSVFIAIKQRASLIMKHFQEEKKNEELSKKDAEIAEQKYELESISEAMSANADLLNIIIQASKLSASDKNEAMERITAQKQNIRNLVEEKQARIESLREKTKDFMEDPGQAINLIAETGNAVLNKYTDKE